MSSEDFTVVMFQVEVFCVVTPCTLLLRYFTLPYLTFFFRG